MKVLRVLQMVFAALAFFSIIFTAIVCGSEDIRIIYPYGLFGIVLLAVGVIGTNAIGNEIEYRERMKKKLEAGK